MKKNIIGWLFFSLFIVIMGFFITFMIITTPIVISGSSMDPTLENADYGITYRYSLKPIKRFDIVIFNYKNPLTDEKEVLVKRVIALPYEEIEYEEGKLYINKQLIEERKVPKGEDNINLLASGDFYKKLGKNEFFVMGDNRIVSFDSRNFGIIKKDAIIGRGFVKLGSCQKVNYGKCEGLKYQFPQRRG